MVLADPCFRCWLLYVALGAGCCKSRPWGQVLADGVAHASRHLKPDLILDMATLTGAQAIRARQRRPGWG